MRGAAKRAVGFVLPKRCRRQPSIAAPNRLKVPRIRIANIDVADVAGVVSHLKPAEPVAPRHKDAQPRRVIVQCEKTDALRRKPSLRARQERQHDPRRVVLEAGRLRA